MTSVFAKDLTDTAAKVLAAAKEKRLRIATAESCTDGLISACLTEISGASDVFDRGFVTYSNDSKMMQLSVERKTLMDCGAVSPETAWEMAEGALRASHADIAISVTGIAGPDGGSDEKPVGLVYISVATRGHDQSLILKNNFTGDRAQIRMATLNAALNALLAEIGKL